MILKHQKFEFGGKCVIERVIIEAPFRYSVHFHNEACFIYFLEGRSAINSPYEQVSIESEESVLLKCGSYFADLLKYSNAVQYEILVVHLYPDILRNIYKQEIPSFVKHAEDKSFIHKIGTHDVVRKFVESLYVYFDNPGLVNDELLELKVKELVLLLVQTRNAASVVSLFTDLFTPRDISMKEVVNNHLFSDVSIEDLASLSNLSVSTFNRAFQTLFNDTPANYIKIKRLERAKDLLAMSSLTVSEIAFQTCFKEVAHFSRSFKAAYHCSPSAYRLSVDRFQREA
jgi:AraC-like DNA-binding protein